MSHITGTVQVLSVPLTIGPASAAIDFPHIPAPGGTKLLMLHFQNVNLPGANRLEVDLGYDTDVFTSADGGSFWTRPINIHAFASGNVPIRYINSGAPAGSVQIDRYGRGERHAGGPGHPSFSNCDPFLPDPAYTEPTYDPFWFCAEPPNWENVRRIPDGDIRAQVAKSVGMVMSVEPPDVYSPVEYVSTCSVTLVDVDKVISAGHCHNPSSALTSSVIFGYETDPDGNRLASYSPRFHKVKASLKHRYDSGFDYSLLQLKTSPVGIAPIQLRHDLPGVGEQIFGVHHPNGAVKKISLPHASFATVTASGAMGIMVPGNFHVSGGSSGSGLFDAAGRIVGVLSNGAPCSGGALLYFPTATILTQIAPAPPPPITRDVVMVIDRSGSMEDGDGTGRRKIDAAKDAVSLFVQLVQADTGNRAGLVSFSTAAGLPTFGITNVTNPNKTALIGGPPFAGGLVGSLTPGGATSIGEGLDAGRAQFPMPGANLRAILLLTDGLQNQPRSIAEVEPALTGIDVHAIGLGSDSNLDGAVLSTLTSGHGGLYTRASSGLALLKFFSQAFGNIFEAGVLLDPEFALPENQSAPPLEFRVCGEEHLTVVVGWDRIDTSLLVQLRTPGGTAIPAGAAGTESSFGRNWAFLRVPLPQGGERDGVWKVEVLRPGGGGEFPPSAPALRYFVNIIPAGGPKLLREPEGSYVYTGDTISPLLRLRQADGGWPDEVEIDLAVLRPDAGAGNLLSDAGLGASLVVDGDEIPARQATLQAIETATGRPAIRYIEQRFTLKEDAANTRGSFEAGGSLGIALPDFMRVEGNYTFHAKATYGECSGTRELVWTVHVDVGIDPGRTDVTTDPLGAQPDGHECLRMTFTPRDKYGNRVGPGRTKDLAISAQP
jgi:von Willebrand factor type A domain/Trypsin-like peptidase domain